MRESRKPFKGVVGVVLPVKGGVHLAAKVVRRTISCIANCKIP